MRIKNIFIAVALALVSASVYSLHGAENPVNSWTWVLPGKPSQPSGQAENPDNSADFDDFPMDDDPSPAANPVSARKIEFLKNRPLSIPDFLRSKGFFIPGSGGTGTQQNVQYAGYSGSDIKVYVDGVLANSPSDGQFDWNTLNVDIVESITVTRYPALDAGQFAGAAVYIITRKTPGRSVVLSASTTSYNQSIADTNRAALQISDSIGSFDFQAGGSFLGAQNDYPAQSARNTANAHHSYEGNFAFGFPAGALRIDGLTRGGYNNTQNYTLNHYWHLDNQNSVTWNSLRIQASENWYGFSTDSSDDDAKNFLQGALAASYEWKNLQFYASSTIGAGVELEVLRWTADFAAGYQLPLDFLDVNLQLSAVMHKGIRSQFGIHPLVRIVIAEPKTGLSLAAGRQLKLPTFNDLYWDDPWMPGNPDLKSEDGWYSDLTWSKFSWLKPFVAVSYLKGKISWGERDDGLWTPMNLEDGWYYSAGVSSEYGWTLGFLSLGYEAGYQFVRACAGSADITADNQIYGVPKHQLHANVNFGLAFDFGTFRFDASWQMIGKRGADPAWNDLGFLLAFTPTRYNGLDVYVKIQNALDERRVYSGYYCLPSRSLTVGCSLQL